MWDASVFRLRKSFPAVKEDLSLPMMKTYLINYTPSRTTAGTGKTARATGTSGKAPICASPNINPPCLSAQLSRFEEICEHREENVKYFDRLLEDVPGVSPSKTEDGCTRRTYYIHLLRYDKDKFAGLSRSKFQQALSKEGTGIGGGYRPLNKEPFLKTILNSRGYQAIYSKKRLDEYWEKNHCPQNDLVTQEGLFMSQRYFLGSRSDVEQVVEAIMKIQKHAEELANA